MHNICKYKNADVHTRRIKENIPRTTRNQDISSVLLIVDIAIALCCNS